MPSPPVLTALEPNLPLDAELPDPVIPISFGMRLATLLAVILPFYGLILAAVSLWGGAFNWFYLAILLVMYMATGLGVTVGFHRLFAHRAFETYRPIKFLLGVCGSMAVEGPLLRWVATHRCHHQHSDDHGDPHSPHLHGQGFKGFVLGLWHAHMGWLFSPESNNLMKYVPDLQKSRLIRFVSRLFPVWVLLGLAIPAGLGWLVTGGWQGALLGLLWGGLVRVLCVHHVTWSVNSICHVWGSRPFKSGDESRNNFVVGVLAFGEGWHNNHHAFPTSARHGLRWWQFDSSWLLLKALSWVGLVWDLKLPNPRAMAALARR